MTGEGWFEKTESVMWQKILICFELQIIGGFFLNADDDTKKEGE